VEFVHFRAFDSRSLERRLRVPVKLESFRVDHSKDAHGAIVTLLPSASLPGGSYGGASGEEAEAMAQEPLVLVYSGDTRPCQQLARTPAHHRSRTPALHTYPRAPTHTIMVYRLEGIEGKGKP
jgi:ribonuclease BN (tRNA processing enzyme)